MIRDARSIARGAVIKGDLCIVGAGPAGISVALQFADLGGVEVLLLESGGVHRERRTQDLYRGEVADPALHHPLHLFRERVLGGTSTVWGGRCVPFDDIDFEERSYVPGSGWPFKKAELDPYYVRANELCEVGGYAYSARDAFPESPAEMIAGFDDSAVTSDRLERWSPPTNFGKRYLNDVKEARNITLILHANCLRLSTSESGTTVRYLTASTFENNAFVVSARQYVIAAGGLEATRILLLSDEHHRGGLGNHAGKLGKFYMSHPTGAVAKLQFASPAAVNRHTFERDAHGIYCRRRFWVTERAQRQKKMLNCIGYPFRPDHDNPDHRSGVLSIVALMKYLQAPEYVRLGGFRRSASGSSLAEVVRRHATNVILDGTAVLAFSWKWFMHRIIARRKIPFVLLPTRANQYDLEFWSEQCPNESSSCRLSDQRDHFGLPRLYVDWRYDELDVHTLVRLHQLIAERLASTNTGRLYYDEGGLADAIRSELHGSAHHMGTTRMSRVASQGVVDENCRVHGVDNLYLASSSVFPTSGHANPTLTIVALALRLADHVRRVGYGREPLTPRVEPETQGRGRRAGRLDGSP